MRGEKAAGRVVRLQCKRSRLQPAVDAFLAQPDLAPSIQRSYGQTLRRLVTDLGAEHEIADLNTNQVEFVVRQAWSRVGAATWNRHRAALRSFVDYCSAEAG